MQKTHALSKAVLVCLLALNSAKAKFGESTVLSRSSQAFSTSKSLELSSDFVHYLNGKLTSNKIIITLCKAQGKIALTCQGSNHLKYVIED